MFQSFVENISVSQIGLWVPPWLNPWVAKWENKGTLATFCSGPFQTMNWADINGDLRLDMLCDNGDGTHQAKLANEDYTYQDTTTIIENFCVNKLGGKKVKFADISGDRYKGADIVCDDLIGNHWIALNNGDGTFNDLGLVQEDRCPGGTTYWGDANGDKFADLICNDGKGNHLIDYGLGNGSFVNHTQVLTNWCYHKGATVTWADINGDGWVDPFCDDTDGMHSGYLNMWFGRFVPLSAWGPWCKGKNSKVHYADYDGDTNYDMICDDGRGNYQVKKSQYHYQDTYDGGQFKNYGVVKRHSCYGYTNNAVWAPFYASQAPPVSEEELELSRLGNWNGNQADLFCDTSRGVHTLQVNTGHCYFEDWVC